ncbi:MAG: hypothetical protein KDK25_07660 [Leptospiraceae bacterium]|nr:hypothetical protein [Leptospiraceae bacterium]MCB1170193.1 hypothetical protein [Leptospiraceae bacterium]
MANQKSGKDRRGEKNPEEEQRKQESEESAIEIDVHEEKIPDSVIKVREEDS